MARSKNTQKYIEMQKASLAELRKVAKDLDIPGAARLKKENLILRIRQAEAEREGLEIRGGILEILSEGIGFLRSEKYQAGQNDIYVSQTQIRRYGLRSGDMVIGHVRPPRESERHYGLLKVESINGLLPEKALPRRSCWLLMDLRIRFELSTT